MSALLVDADQLQRGRAQLPGEGAPAAEERDRSGGGSSLPPPPLDRSRRRGGRPEPPPRWLRTLAFFAWCAMTVALALLLEYAKRARKQSER